MSDHLRRTIHSPTHYQSNVNSLIEKSRRERALHRSQQRALTPTSAPTSLLTPLAFSHQLRTYPRSRAAGPRPPPSWAYPAHASSAASNNHRSSPGSATPHSEWRARALGWIFAHIDRPGLIPHAAEAEDIRSPIPTLREMCLCKLLAPDRIDDQIINSDLPAHIRRFIVRHASIHSPLPWEALADLWGVAYGEQGADGEIILIGKDAGGFNLGSAFVRDAFTPAEIDAQPAEGETEEQLAWDAEEYTPPPLGVLISLAHPLSKHLSFFPPTITHLALVASPLDPDTTPRAMMSKLSGILHLLEALDLSYNSWLVHGALTSVDWSKKWPRLRAIAFVSCPNLLDESSITNTINNKRNWEKYIHIDFA